MRGRVEEDNRIRGGQEEVGHWYEGDWEAASRAGGWAAGFESQLSWVIAVRG